MMPFQVIPRLFFVFLAQVANLGKAILFDAERRLARFPRFVAEVSHSCQARLHLKADGRILVVGEGFEPISFQAVRPVSRVYKSPPLSKATYHCWCP